MHVVSCASCAKHIVFEWIITDIVCVPQGEAVINYNKLQADPKQGKSLDIGISSIHRDSVFVYLLSGNFCSVPFGSTKHVRCVFQC